jgi:glycerate dehydrogenase
MYRELCGKTWGIIGYGNIGRQVGEVAKALGCNVVVYKRTPCENCNVVDIDNLCKQSDIITIHTPLNDGTYHLIDEKRLSLMKKDVIIVNTARGLVTDEKAVADAVKENRIGAFGTDVYSLEPISEENPIFEIKDYPNVILTPHMAWGALESRQRCINEVSENIKACFNGQKRNRVD